MRCLTVLARTREYHEGCALGFLVLTVVLLVRFETSLKALRPTGTFVSMGSASGAIEAFDPNRLVKNIKFVRPS